MGTPAEFGSGGWTSSYQADFEEIEYALELPFSAYAFQRDAFCNLAPLPASALYHEPGLGKTFTSSLTALFKMMKGHAHTTIVLMPPVLLHNWRRFLAKIKRRGGLPLDVVLYEGTPAKRKAIKLTGHEFVLMSLDIFKRDFERISADLFGIPVHVVVDEATSIKNIESKNHQLVKEFAEGNTLQLLTGTPLNKPIDAYAYIKLLSPTTYRSKTQFERIHVEEYDFFDNPKKYCNLDLLQQNLLINADRRLKEEVLLDLPPVVISAQEYALDPAHAKLYRRLVEDQLLVLTDGSKIDASTPQKLNHKLGQIVCNWQHFDPDQTKQAMAFELVQQLLDELGSGKLVVFANYKMTNRAIMAHFQHVNVVGIWGEVSPKDKQRAIDRFIDDPTCRLMTLQPSSAGLGIDGLQHVCSEIFYLEPPVTPSLLDQSLSRLYRDGQRKSVNVRIGTATGTCQVHAVQALVEKKELVDYLQGAHVSLKSMLYGE